MNDLPSSVSECKLIVNRVNDWAPNQGDPVKIGEPLTDEDKNILDMETRYAGRLKNLGTKERVIRERLGLPAVRYYQKLLRLLEHPEAEAYAPMLVHRLRRRVATRAGRVA